MSELKMSELRFSRLKDDKIKVSEPRFARLKDGRMKILQSCNPINLSSDKL